MIRILAAALLCVSQFVSSYALAGSAPSSKSIAAPSFEWDPASPEIGELAQLTITQIPGKIEAATWTFDEAGCGDFPNTYTCTRLYNDCTLHGHRFATSGAHTVSLQLTLVGSITLPAFQRTITVLNSGSCGLAQGPPFFSDGFESGSLCSWPSEAAACGVGTEMVITLPGDAVTMTLMYIPPGTFLMGSPVAERGREAALEDLHEVTLTSGYYVGRYEVTQAQWLAVMGTTPWETCGGNGTGPDYPVYCATWDEVAGPGGFVETLNTYLASTSQTTGFRLPTDAEFERAVRAWTQTRFSYGDVLECDDFNGACPAHNAQMWWGGSQPYTAEAHPVGLRLANGYGLYDMHGNQGEWVQDRFQQHLGTWPVIDPIGPATGTVRVYRGCGWGGLAYNCRSASRNGGDPTFRGFGFRLARPAD